MPSGPFMLELEITGRCQMRCGHLCYAQSGPTGTHGSMTIGDWADVIDQAADLDVPVVQFIGGEPTTHPALADLIERAVRRGRRVNVFSNLYKITVPVWQALTQEGVQLSTSWYSDRPEEHDEVTGRAGSYARSKANVAKAVQLGVPVRGTIIPIRDGERVDAARTDLQTLGVTAFHTNRIQALGNAARPERPDDVSELCGHCGRGRAAVSPEGDVWPCVMSRWLRAGNVKEEPLKEILRGTRLRELVATVPAPAGTACPPADSGDCNPANTPACNPAY